MQKEDWLSKRTGQWVQEASGSDAAFRQLLMQEPFNLVELHQPSPTHKSNLVLSRLDRAYHNGPRTDHIPIRHANVILIAGQ